MSDTKASTWQIIKAVLGAFIGVQSEKQRLQDFQSDSAVPYIVTGILMAALFVSVLLLIVSYVVP